MGSCLVCAPMYCRSKNFCTALRYVRQFGAHWTDTSWRVCWCRLPHCSILSKNGRNREIFAKQQNQSAGKRQKQKNQNKWLPLIPITHHQKTKELNFFLRASGNTQLFNRSNFFVHSFLGLILFLKVCRADWQSIRVYCPSIKMKRVGKLKFTDFDWVWNSYQDFGWVLTELLNLRPIVCRDP